MHNNTDELLIATKFFVSETVPTYEVPRDKKTETRLRLRNGKHNQAVDTLLHKSKHNLEYAFTT